MAKNDLRLVVIVYGMTLMWFSQEKEKTMLTHQQLVLMVVPLKQQALSSFSTNVKHN